MQGVLVLAHGSRENQTEETMNQVVEMVRHRFFGLPIEVAYMEFRSQTIEKGLERLLQLGVKEIKAIPYFLFDGIHIRQDIPEELERFRAAHPGVQVTLGKTLGPDRRLADILEDRIRQCLGEEV